MKGFALAFGLLVGGIWLKRALSKSDQLITVVGCGCVDKTNKKKIGCDCQENSCPHHFCQLYISSSSSPSLHETCNQITTPCGNDYISKSFFIPSELRRKPYLMNNPFLKHLDCVQALVLVQNEKQSILSGDFSIQKVLLGETSLLLIEFKRFNSNLQSHIFQRLNGEIPWNEPTNRQPTWFNFNSPNTNFSGTHNNYLLNRESLVPHVLMLSLTQDRNSNPNLDLCVVWLEQLCTNKEINFMLTNNPNHSKNIEKMLLCFKQNLKKTLIEKHLQLIQQQQNTTLPKGTSNVCLPSQSDLDELFTLGYKKGAEEQFKEDTTHLLDKTHESYQKGFDEGYQKAIFLLSQKTTNTLSSAN